MAESVVFSLACKLLSTIASPAFEKAYEKGLSIWEASDELAKLRVTIETIQAILLDAEKKQQGSAVVEVWIKRLKGVLYDADDLFDEVATNDLLKQQMRKGNNKLSLKNKVRVSCSNLNPVVSRNSIAKKVKAIRKSLSEISTDMAGLGFLSCVREEEMPNGMRKGQDPGCFVDANDVIGRGEDKKAILEMFFNESDDAKPDVPVVIAIVGIGGMGKTTLAQLIYNDEKVKRSFENRWFACISDIYDEKEVLGKIFESVNGENHTNFTVSQLQTRIREMIEGKNFLLVLDDVWDENHGRWLNRMKLLSNGAKGSNIIVTTRSSSVARAVGALETRQLEGLSEDDSWDLFKRVAFAPGNENDPRRIKLGREIVKKCANVPLALRCIGSLLFEKNTIQEWESIRDANLPKLRQSHEDGIIPVLKLSYDHLHSNLKQCFAYCSLFPKDYKLYKEELVYLWIAQGYVESDNVEDTCHLYFMCLLRRGFFQDAKEDSFGEIETCKMHDLVHDLACHVAGEECTTLTDKPSNASNCTRHASIVDDSWVTPTSLCNGHKLRSFLFMDGSSICKRTLDQLFANFKQLRTLRLFRLGIMNVPSSIGELKHLRYLDLAGNKFESLPDSVTNLLNLITLDICWCRELTALPDNLRRLINLRYLNISRCILLRHMPAGFGELSSLQYLSNFKVIEGVEKGSGLDALAGLQQLRGELRIEFGYGIIDWYRDECNWQLPVSPQQLDLLNYPGTRVPHWSIDGRANNLATLHLNNCKKLKYLPPLRCLPNLRWLFLEKLRELEFMEVAEDICTFVVAGSSSSFFPRLEKLELRDMPKLKGWSSSSSELLSFPFLFELTVEHCPQLKSIPPCPRLTKLSLLKPDGNEAIQRVLSNNTSCASATPSSSSFNEILTSPLLEAICIYECNDLESMDLAPPKLRQLWINSCRGLKKLRIAHPNVLEELMVRKCPELELWDEEKRVVDWNSLSGLGLLELDPPPIREELPHCLRHRYELGQLQIPLLLVSLLPRLAITHQ